MYPPQPPNYDAATVENVRQERIRAIKRRYNISLGLQIAFTGVFAALLGYYIWRDRDNRRRTTDDGFVYYNSNWFSWYIGLLIALLVIDLLSIFFTIRNRKRALAWLTNPNTPPHMIMSGMNPQSDYAEVVVIQQPAGYVQTGYAQPAYQNYQPPPPMYSQAPGQQQQQQQQGGNFYMPPAGPPPAHQGNNNGDNAGSRGHLEKPLI